MMDSNVHTSSYIPDVYTVDLCHELVQSVGDSTLHKMIEWNEATLLGYGNEMY
jgi:hypothetical protein